MRTVGQRLVAIGAVVVVVGVSGGAAAQPKAPQTPGDRSDKGTVADAKDKKPADGRGVVPYDQLILDANKAFAAGLAGGVLDEAIAGYRKTIALDPTRPEGHLFLGAALFQKGDYPAADEAAAAATNHARADRRDLNVLGKALMFAATVKDAMNRAEDAVAAWGAYEAFAKENPDQAMPKTPTAGDAPPMVVKVYPASATDRIAKIGAYQKMYADYAKVRELIAKRQKELGIEPKPAAPK